MNNSYSEVFLAKYSTDSDILNKLSQDEDYYVRYWVARNPNTKPENLDVLSRDEYPDVRYWVARNPNTKSETLDTLSQDEDAYVRRWVAEHPNCSERAYKYIMGLNLLRDLQKTLEGR